MFRAFCVAYAMEGSTFLEAGNISLSKTFDEDLLVLSAIADSPGRHLRINF